MIVLMCMLLFVGTVFTTGPLRNREIERDEALAVAGTFERVDPAYNKGNLKYIDLVFSDGEEQTIDGCCVRQGLEERLEQIPAGTQMRLLVHPKSNCVLQLEVNGQILLDFDNAQEYLWQEAMAFMWLGAFMYAVTVYFIVRMVRKKL